MTPDQLVRSHSLDVHVKGALFPKNQTRHHHMRFTHRLGQLIGVVASLLFLAAPIVRSQNIPPNFTVTQYSSNLGANPTAMAFAPDGRLFVCMQGGDVLVISSNGTLLATPFVTVPTTAINERGLVGITFDPNFTNNQFVYLYYTVSGTPAHNRVSRFTADGDIAVPGSETPIMDLDDLGSESSHNGGAMHFGLDGKLYVAVGENRIAANAQSIDNRLGKMLRINSDGTIPPDNPTTFPGITGSPTGANRAIWAVGLRNPFTFAIQPGTGRIFIDDVGELTWEEINDGIAGSNYGWSICEGVCAPPNPNYRDPFFTYTHGASDVSGCAITGGTFYNPPVNQFPAVYVGKYFFTDFCTGWIRMLDPSTGVVGPFTTTGIRSPVNLEVGNDGSLYYLARGNGGQVFRIQYLPPPTPTPPPAQSLNLSARLRVETGDNLMIGGFIVSGSQSKATLLRGIGPSLIGSGVPPNAVLLDPVLELRGPSISPAQNDNWRDSPFRSMFEGTAYQPSDDHEAVIFAQVQPGAYTVLLTGKDQTNGIGLVEVYDFDQGQVAKLANLSARGLIQTQANVMIGGFILGGSSASAKVAVRGIGPSLSHVGLSNLLADPTLELRDESGTLLVANDDWQDDPIAASNLTFLGLAPGDPHESGIFTSLPPGSFSAILAGKNGGTGIGLIEIYNVP